ncbi:MAG: hypothetical protein QXE34_01990, partial [Candidatus Aenigmatarchaeota archaeon]
SELKKEINKIEKMEKILDMFHKRISNIENKIEKINNSVLLSEKRIDMVRKEKDLINDKIYDVKEDFYFKIKELEDAISIIEEKIKAKRD